jgi:hypothetical protein
MSRTLELTKRRVRIGIQLMKAWELGCHEGWRDPICGHAFDALVDAGLMELKSTGFGSSPLRRLTPSGIGTLINILDVLAVNIT